MWANCDDAAMRTLVTAARLWDGTSLHPSPAIEIEDDRVVAVGTQSCQEYQAERLDFPGATLAPAYLDVHIHGAAGHDVTNLRVQSGKERMRQDDALKPLHRVPPRNDLRLL